MRGMRGGWVAIAKCDREGCAARLECAGGTEPEAAVSLVYAAHEAGWGYGGFPHGVYCPACKDLAAADLMEARLAAVRRGYTQMRRLYAELGITVDDEDRMGSPTRAFAGLGGIMRGSAGQRRGVARADTLAIAESLSDLATLANGLTWAEVRA